MIENYLELVDIESIDFTEEYDNMIDISIDIDETFSLYNGIVSHNSASSSIIAGLSEVDASYWGVFPLRGKPMNVRDASLQKIKDNEEIKNIISILGLEFGKKYTDTKKLRYGKVVLMADADCIDENMMILTKRGYVSIKDVNYEDEVFTHNKEWKKIINIIKTEKTNIVNLNINGEIYSFGENHIIPIVRDGEILMIEAINILKTDKVLKKKN